MFHLIHFCVDKSVCLICHNRAIVFISILWIIVILARLSVSQSFNHCLIWNSMARNEIGLISVKVCSMRVTLHDLEERNIYELVWCEQSFTSINILLSVSNHLESLMCNHLEWSFLCGFLKSHSRVCIDLFNNNTVS